MDLSIEKGALLLLIAAVVAMLTRRLRLPYSVGLVAAGVALALVPFSPRIDLTKDLLFTGLLPPLIFEAAFYLSWKELRKHLPVVLVLATLGVLIAAGVSAAGVHYFAGWQWRSALVFGVLIAATDPVAVIATFKEARVRGRLLLLIESESLFNDGTAAVLFAISLELMSGGAFHPMQAVFRLTLTVVGSLVCGAAVAGAALVLAGRTQDHLVEITFTTVAAYGSFLLAEYLHLSGVLGTLTAGLILGNVGQASLLTGREAIQAFWEYAAFVANSMVFLLIGMHEGSQHFFAAWSSMLVAVMAVTAARAISVYPCCALFARSALRVDIRHQHVLVWGGLRGALALALALGLPPGMPERELIVMAAFAVVAFSVFVQGLTLPPLLRAFGEIPRLERR